MGGERSFLSTIRSPRRVKDYAELQFKKLKWQLQNRSLWQFLGHSIEILTKKNPYYQGITRLAPSPYIRREINRIYFDLPVFDNGISRTLLAYGVHELLSTRAFAHELHRLASTVDGEVTVFEIGANIGYYCLLEAAILKDQARIYAVEPDPDNAALLKRNIRLNEYEDVINISRLAIGDQSKPVLLYNHKNANRHTVLSSSDAEARRGLSKNRTIPVTQRNAIQFLKEQEVELQSINVIRMDVEGYEQHIFNAIEALLVAPGPTCLYVEIHPRYLSSEEIETIVGVLADNDFEIVSTIASEGVLGVFEPSRWHGISQSIEDFTDLRTYLLNTDHYLELIVRKGYG